MEFIPIGTILAVLTNQVAKTSSAAKDVVFEKESFRVLSKHLSDIEPVLKELQLQELNESQAARQALEALEADVKRANNLVEKYTQRARFYLLLKCRHIVKEVQDVTRDIGRSLASLSLANTEVLHRISDQVHRLQNEMQRVEFETSSSQLQIVDKLDQGLRDNKLDQAFANDMLEEIAMAVGVPIEPSAISTELANFKREKEEADFRKERAEVFFFGQVIELLSRADAARDYEEVKKQYEQRVQAIERYNSREEYILPLNSFLCCINGTVMTDPVSLCTGTTCERAAIADWFESGKRTDPDTHEVLENTSFRSNLPLRQSIEEWRELNYCLRIRSSKEKLLSGVDKSMDEALNQMQDLMRESSINKDWISIEGFNDIIVNVLRKSHNNDLKRKILITLKYFVEGHTRNKEALIESQGWSLVIRCLGHDAIISKAAIELLYELLQDRSGWNGSVQETAEIAESIMLKLLDIDEETIHRAAKASWYKPLIDCIVKGPECSRISCVRSIVNMELSDSNLKHLGEEGVIPPLIEMASGNIESKELSLSALVKLAGCRANKKPIAETGGVDFVVNLMSTPNVPTFIVVKCCEVLEKLSSDDDSIKYFVDKKGTELELELIVANLLALLQNPNSANNVRRPALRALLGICKFEAGLVKKAVLTIKGVSLVLPLLDDSDSEIREVAIKLLFLFSQHEPDGVVEYLLRPRRLEALVGFLENGDKDDLKMSAAGLLANLPKSEKSLTMKLIESNGHTALIEILNTGTMAAKENALSALFRFTDPENLDSQRILVEAGAYPLLVNLLKANSVSAKARAAALIGNLSTSTPKLPVESKSSFAGVSNHQANALPDLVKLLDGEVEEIAFEAIQTLSTLVDESCPQKGAIVLHEAKAINPILNILDWGTKHLKEEALGLLEKVFVSKEILDIYSTKARFHLVSLTGGSVQADGRLTRKAAKVLSLVERFSRSSTSLVSVLHS
ncbi:hypothetical protein F8388_003398 [Cannabis sativa]|uniref:RING-type E3 ubiquitin transferase n=1 Tax=Cannabis sativa TaxID=3483 RepID=A0A7J6E2W8_CANSA|nr:hypothetical protein F8388_003398 [Cannabis sativa]